MLQILDQSESACGMRASLLQGGSRMWWDLDSRQMVRAVTLYLAQGCPDWGEKNGKRNHLCTFCCIPNAVIAYRELCYDGQDIPQAEHVRVFAQNLAETVDASAHTLLVFNGGSFLSERSNAPATQIAVTNLIAQTGVRRLVIESRAELITEEGLRRLTDILFPAGIKLTVRIGIESKNDTLRLRVLKKGHKRAHLERAIAALRAQGVQCGGYCLLKPAPDSGLLQAMDAEYATADEINAWALQEAKDSLDWILGESGLGMDEAYFCSTNVGDGSVLTEHWQRGEFSPANLWMVYEVLRHAAQRHGPRVHLLPFKEEPQLLAVPSNHVAGGIAQNLHNAKGCDREFHAMFERYRSTMDAAALKAPCCACRPAYLEASAC